MIRSSALSALTFSSRYLQFQERTGTGGLVVGVLVGYLVGAVTGASVDILIGDVIGRIVGLYVCQALGFDDGCNVGRGVGKIVGRAVGTAVVGLTVCCKDREVGDQGVGGAIASAVGLKVGCKVSREGGGDFACIDGRLHKVASDDGKGPGWV